MYSYNSKYFVNNICIYFVTILNLLLFKKQSTLFNKKPIKYTVLNNRFVIWTRYDNVPQDYLGACVVVSSLSVLARTFFISLHAKSSISILRSIYPVMFDLMILVAIILFFYAVIGFEVFQDKLVC